MKRFIVYSLIEPSGCWECGGGGDNDVWQVLAYTAEDATNQVADTLRLESWDNPVELHAVQVAPSRARKPRILRPSEWLNDWSAIVEPPALAT